MYNFIKQVIKLLYFAYLLVVTVFCALGFLDFIFHCT